MVDKNIDKILINHLTKPYGRCIISMTTIKIDANIAKLG
jgi:hypothetical protein